MKIFDASADEIFHLVPHPQRFQTLPHLDNFRARVFLTLANFQTSAQRFLQPLLVPLLFLLPRQKIESRCEILACAFETTRAVLDFDYLLTQIKQSGKAVRILSPGKKWGNPLLSLSRIEQVRCLALAWRFQREIRRKGLRIADEAPSTRGLKYISRVLLIAAGTEKWVRLSHPHLLLVPDTREPISRWVSTIAVELKIRTVVMAAPFSSFLRDRDTTTPHEEWTIPFLNQERILFGTERAPKNEFPILDPRLGQAMETARESARRTRPENRKRLGISNEEKILVLALQGVSEDLQAIQRLERICADLKRTQFIVRPHPGQNSGWVQKAFPGVRVSRVLSPMEVVTVADLVVTRNSSLALYAVIAGTPVLSYEDRYGNPGFPGLMRAGLVLGAPATAHWAVLVQSLLRTPPPPRPSPFDSLPTPEITSSSLNRLLTSCYAQGV